MKNKVFAVIIATLFLFSFFITVDGIPLALATNEAETPQSIGEFQGEQDVPIDISDSISQKEALSGSEKKLSSKILQLTDSKYLSSGTTQGELIKQMKDQEQIAEVPITNGINRSSSGLNVYVYIKLEKGSDLEILSPYVSQIANQDVANGLVAAWVDINLINNLASLDEVQSIREVILPVVNSGSVTSEGAALHKTDLVHAQTGANGTGVKVGIISDGVDNYLSAVSSSDLPSNVTILSNARGGDEGTAMLEIVHDLAPGAQLYFHDCGSSTLDFNDAIDALVSAGCDVICDDIGWITEPFFEDGTVALHIQSVCLSNDIIYVSSAGNAGNKHYQGTFYNDGNGWADFSSGTQPTTGLYAFLPAGESIRVVMEWNEAFGASVNDYDLYLANVSTGDTLASSTYEQNGDDDPIEFLYYENNTGSDMDVVIAAHAYNAPENKTLEIYAYGVAMYTNNIVVADSIFGHAAVQDVLSCGALSAATPDTIETFSSQGPVVMLSGTRQKPDICGIDGVSITGAGGFPNPFYGTSAAAPHIAAVTAVLKSRFPSMTVGEIKGLMQDHCIDLGSAGYDNVYGYGRSDALSAALSSVYVIFDSRGGTAIDSQLIVNGEKATQPSEPTKVDCTFNGWYKEDTYVTEWIFDSDTVTVDTTLYAKYEVSFAQGDGTPGDPYGISTPTQLNEVRNHPNANFLLLNDIDLSSVTSEGGEFYNDGAGWEPIGDSSTPFTGVLDGGGYEIRGLGINLATTSSNNYIGLLGYVQGSVKNLDINSASISINTTGDVYAGGIVGFLKDGTIQNCRVNNVSLDAYGNYASTGGITGYAWTSTIEDSSFSGDVNANGYGTDTRAGGIVGLGRDETRIRRCFNTGSIYAEGHGALAGGIVGCITRTASNNFQGIYYCYNTGNVSVKNSDNTARCAGIAAYASYTSINNCFNMGEISEHADSTYHPTIGGIVGYTSYPIASAPVSIYDCYNIGNLNGAGYIGGIAGASVAGIEDCYYANIIATGIGDGTGTTYQKTLEQMKQQTTYTGFNFTAYWEIVEGQRFPILQVVPFNYVSGISVDESLLLNVGESETLTPVFTPSNTSNKNVSWTSSNESIATVEDGNVTLISKGTATITVTTQDGEFSNTCEVAAYVPVNSVSLNKTSLTLVIGDSETLTPTVLPNDATYPEVTWSSNDETVTTVNSSGLITTVGVGNATITATADGVSDTCDVNVEPKHVTSVSLSSHEETMCIGDTLTLTAEVLPNDATYPDVTWTSSDESVATVNSSGMITAMDEGSTTITATADGISDTCDVTVEIKHVTSVSLSSHEKTMYIGDSVVLSATVLPNDATYPEVTWSSNDEMVATVNSSGLITTVGVGSATITATADGVSDTCDVTVEPKHVTSVSLSSHEETMCIEDTLTLTAEVLPNDATYPDVKWTSSDESIATVNSSGMITAMDEGSAMITATADGASDTCTVTVMLRKIQSSVYSVDQTNSLLKGVPINISISELKANLQNESSNIYVYDKDNLLYKGSKIATGMTVKLIVNGTVQDELQIAILGDCSGDGKISITDYTLVRLDILDLKKLQEAFKAASDVSKDGKISITDYTLIRLDILDLKKIY